MRFRNYETVNPNDPEEDVLKKQLSAPMVSPKSKLVEIEEDYNTKEQKMRLMDCTMREEYEVVEVLLSKGVDPNYVHPDSGKTPFIAVLEKKNVQMANLYLEAPTLKINQTDLTGQTPLIVVSKMAMTSEELDNTMINLLRKLILDVEGVNINAQDAGGNTALHYATVNSDYAFAEKLISRNANVNIPNAHGMTPVHSAAAQDHINLCLLFVRHGAQLANITVSGKVAGDLATDFQLKQTLFGQKTSLTHPLQINFIDLKFLGKKMGSLGISMCPGRVYQLWSRDLQFDLGVIAQNFTVLVSVITRKELTEMGLNDFTDSVRRKGIEYYQISIANGWLPTSAEDFKQLTSIIVTKISEGKNVLVHCDSGKSRSSLFAAAVMVQLGATQEKTKQILRGMSEDYLSNPAHVIYLSKFKAKNLEINNEENSTIPLEAEESVTSSGAEAVDGVLSDTTFSV
jgi:ankyrin repeat protein